jgi:hypothetical protein
MLSQVACIIFVAVVLSYHGLVDFFISHVFCLRDKRKSDRSFNDFLCALHLQRFVLI